MKPKDSSPTVAIGTPRGRGRPRATEQMSTVSTWIPASAHDKLIQVANAQEMSVSEVVRNVLIQNVLILNIFQVKS